MVPPLRSTSSLILLAILNSPEQAVATLRARRVAFPPLDQTLRLAKGLHRPTASSNGQSTGDRPEVSGPVVPSRGAGGRGPTVFMEKEGQLAFQTLRPTLSLVQLDGEREAHQGAGRRSDGHPAARKTNLQPLKAPALIPSGDLEKASGGGGRHGSPRDLVKRARIQARILPDSGRRNYYSHQVTTTAPGLNQGRNNQVTATAPPTTALGGFGPAPNLSQARGGRPSAMRLQEESSDGDVTKSTLRPTGDRAPAAEASSTAPDMGELPNMVIVDCADCSCLFRQLTDGLPNMAIDDCADCG